MFILFSFRARNLLGYVRHNGFVPWDDDIDFALIREEYEKLKEYCTLHIYSEEEWNHRENAQEKEIEPGMENYYWTLLHDHFYIMEVLDPFTFRKNPADTRTHLSCLRRSSPRAGFMARMSAWVLKYSTCLSSSFMLL